MNIIQFLTLLFKKIGDVDSIQAALDSISKIPKALSVALITIVLLGGVYFGYSKLYTYEVDSLKQEVIELQDVVTKNVQKDDYSHDIYYLIEAIKMCEQINHAAYDGEQFKLDLFIQYVQKYTPNDPILLNLEAMKRRNQYNYDHWSVEFQRIIEHCTNKCKQKEKKDEHNNDK